MPTWVTAKVHNGCLATGKIHKFCIAWQKLYFFFSSNMLCLQIVECRRVLKWTYAYGYYLPEPEHAKRQFFEYLQGTSFPPAWSWDCISSCFVPLQSICHASEAESGLEWLHQCAEKELQVYLNAEGPSKDFNEFRTKLAGLTRWYSTENLTRAFICIIWRDQELT